MPTKLKSVQPTTKQTLTPSHDFKGWLNQAKQYGLDQGVTVDVRLTLSFGMWTDVLEAMAKTGKDLDQLASDALQGSNVFINISNGDVDLSEGEGQQ